MQENTSPIVPTGQQLDVGQLSLEAGGQPLRGIVTDVGGGAVPGATVSATLFDRTAWLEPDAKHVTSTTYTRDDGSYELSLADGEYWVSVWHVDYMRASSNSLVVRGAPITKDFVLTPGGTIEGRVVTRGGEPVPGAQVSASSGAAGGFGDRGPSAQAVADDKGHFVMRGLGSGALRVSASGGGYASADPTTVELGVAEQVSDVEVVVDRAFKIAGRVVEKGNEQQGIADVKVGAWTMSGSGGGDDQSTAADGTFLIEGLRPGTYNVFAMGKGVVGSMMGHSATIKDRDVTEMVIALGRGVTIRGRVEPPGPAQVGLELQDENVGFGNMDAAMAAGSAHAKAAADGTFELSGVPAGKYYVIAEADDGAAGRTAVEVADRPLDGVVVTLAARAWVAGVVVDPTGKPLAGLGVSLKALRGERGMSMSFMGADDMANRTAANGTFRIDGVDPGKYGVRVRDEDGTLAQPTKAEFTVTGTTPVQGLRVVVELPHGVIRGTVRTKTGEPVPDAWVSARRAVKRHRSMDEDDIDSWLGGGVRPVLTDKDGRFAIEKLRAGKYDLSAEGMRGSRRGKVTGIEPDADVVIEVRAVAGLTGVVTNGGVPVAQYELRLSADRERDPFSRSRHVVAADGRYRIDHLDPGEYDLAVAGEDGTASGKIKIEPETTATLNLALEPFGSLTGRVVDARTKAPVAGLLVAAASHGGLYEGFMDLLSGKGPKTDADGRFVIVKVAAGDGTLYILNDMNTVATRKYTVPAGQRLDIGTVEGLIVAPVPENERGSLGVTFDIATWENRPGAGDTPTAPPQGVGAEDGLLWVESVEADGPAAAAGLLAGDRVLAVDGVEVAAVGAETVFSTLMMGTVRVGQVVKLKMERNGAAQEIAIAAGK